MAAIVAVCQLALHLPMSHSLKDKRQVVRSLQARLRNTYNVSVAETGPQDSWQLAELLVTYAASDARQAEEVLANVVAFTEEYHLPVELLESQQELVYFS